MFGSFDAYNYTGGPNKFSSLSVSLCGIAVGLAIGLSLLFVVWDI